jgi:hypothetical protein
MKGLGNISGLFQRHYEKVLLALGILGLVVAVVSLNNKKTQEDELISGYERGIPKRKPKPYEGVDVSALASAMQRATNPPALNFTPPHNLLNPVKWQQRPDGGRLKVETGREIGPAALVVTGIEPLNTIVTLDKPSGSGFLMSVVQEAHTNALLRRKYQSYVTTAANQSDRADRTKTFTLREAKGTPEAPVVDVELFDGTRAEISADKPFTRVAGYKADLTYPPENKKLPDKRVGDELKLAGEDYIVVAITPNEVVVSARSNDRRTTIRNNAAK